MIPLFGILAPATGPVIASPEAPLKKPFFGAPPAVPKAGEGHPVRPAGSPTPAPRPESIESLDIISQISA
jgi:hypothetical protein